jgi:hypothetical protein
MSLREEEGEGGFSFLFAAAELLRLEAGDGREEEGVLLLVEVTSSFGSTVTSSSCSLSSCSLSWSSLPLEELGRDDRPRLSMLLKDDPDVGRDGDFDFWPEAGRDEFFESKGDEGLEVDFREDFSFSADSGRDPLPVG